MKTLQKIYDSKKDTWWIALCIILFVILLTYLIVMIASCSGVCIVLIGIVIMFVFFGLLITYLIMLYTGGLEFMRKWTWLGPFDVFEIFGKEHPWFILILAIVMVIVGFVY